MTEAVLDASVVLKWFHRDGETDSEAAYGLRERVRSRTLKVLAPPILHLEIINVAGRRWRFEKEDLIELARALARLPIEIRNPTLDRVAEWTSRGLSAYDASYVALAHLEHVPLLTGDEQMLRLAPAIARRPAANA